MTSAMPTPGQSILSVTHRNLFRREHFPVLRSRSVRVWQTRESEAKANRREGTNMTNTAESARASEGSVSTGFVENVADILERELQTVTDEWLARVEKEPDLTHIPLNYEERTGHLPH